MWIYRGLSCRQILVPMTTPTPLERCFQYMRAFEVAFVTGDWSVLDPHFRADAVHTIAGGGPLSGRTAGRDAVIAGLRAGVDGIDRRFDVRIPEVIEGPVTRGDGVWMRFRLTLRRAGLPDLCIEGDHLASYRDGAIAKLAERLADDTAQRVGAYLARWGDSLRPAGSAFAPPQRRTRSRGPRRRRRPQSRALLRRGEERAGRRRRAGAVQRGLLDRHGRVRRRVARSQGDRAAPRALLPELPRLPRDARRFRERARPRRVLGSRARDLRRRLPRPARHRQERRSPGLLRDGDARRRSSRASASSSTSPRSANRSTCRSRRCRLLCARCGRRRERPGIPRSALQRCAVPRQRARNGGPRSPAARRVGSRLPRCRRANARAGAARGRRAALVVPSLGLRDRRGRRRSRRRAGRRSSPTSSATTLDKSLFDVFQRLAWGPERLAALGPRSCRTCAASPTCRRALWIVENVGTRPDLRRRGLVGALLERALERGRERGFAKAQISCLIGNDAAQRAYEKAGFARRRGAARRRPSRRRSARPASRA